MNFERFQLTDAIAESIRRGGAEVEIKVENVSEEDLFAAIDSIEDATYSEPRGLIGGRAINVRNVVNPPNWKLRIAYFDRR